MKQKTYLSVVTVFFVAVAVLHLLRISLGWQAVIGGRVIPLWASLVAFLLALYLAYEGFRHTKV